MTTDIATKLLDIISSSKVELCGVITNEGTVIQIRNVAPSDLNTFIFDRADYFTTINKLKATGDYVVSTWHNHPNCDSNPSQCDMEFFERSNLDMVIVSSDGIREIKHA